MIVAVVLSAGESSRMGRPKALLPIEGQTFIEKIIGALKQSSVGKVIVVLGHNAEDMRARIRQAPITSKEGRDYMRLFLSGASDDVPDKLVTHLFDVREGAVTRA